MHTYYYEQQNQAVDYIRNIDKKIGSKKVEASKFESFYNKCEYNKPVRLTFGRDEDAFTFDVKRRLSAHEAEYIVTAVCHCVVDSETGTYRPWLKDYSLRVAVLETYTNLNLPHEDFEACWDLVYGTPIFAKITGNERQPVAFDNWEYDDNNIIDVEQYKQIVTAIDQLIDYTVRYGY